MTDEACSRPLPEILDHGVFPVPVQLLSTGGSICAAVQYGGCGSTASSRCHHTAPVTAAEVEGKINNTTNRDELSTCPRPNDPPTTTTNPVTLQGYRRKRRTRVGFSIPVDVTARHRRTSDLYRRSNNTTSPELRTGTTLKTPVMQSDSELNVVRHNTADAGMMAGISNLTTGSSIFTTGSSTVTTGSSMTTTGNSMMTSDSMMTTGSGEEYMTCTAASSSSLGTGAGGGPGPSSWCSSSSVALDTYCRDESTDPLRRTAARGCTYTSDTGTAATTGTAMDIDVSSAASVGMRQQHCSDSYTRRDSATTGGISGCTGGVCTGGISACTGGISGCTGGVCTGGISACTGGISGC
eukprot:Lankesteria_metandrocarpae@DN9471_c0_g1_i1.p1